MKVNACTLRLVKLLSDGNVYSSHDCAVICNMSRSAVLRHIQELPALGISIRAIRGKGYGLSHPLKLLDPVRLQTLFPENEITILPVVDSTNQYLLDRVTQLQSGDACIAECQQAGRGRRGKQWISPFGSNLYFSYYWRFTAGIDFLGGLSLVIGVVVAEVLQRLGVPAVQVKWPNDLYAKGKKLGGILIESSTKMQDHVHVVIGCGINIAMDPRVKADINQPWISVAQTGVDIDRTQLSVALLQALPTALTLFAQQGLSIFLTRWHALDLFLHHPVRVLAGDQVISGISRGVDAQGALCVEGDGIIHTFSHGEVSLRGDAPADYI